jgi:hypothetical protein
MEAGFKARLIAWNSAIGHKAGMHDALGSQWSVLLLPL